MWVRVSGVGVVEGLVLWCGWWSGADLVVVARVRLSWVSLSLMSVGSPLGVCVLSCPFGFTFAWNCVPILISASFHSLSTCFTIMGVVCRVLLCFRARVMVWLGFVCVCLACVRFRVLCVCCGGCGGIGTGCGVVVRSLVGVGVGSVSTV